MFGLKKDEESSSEDRELQVADELLKGKGLNHSSFTRAYLNKEEINNQDKDQTKEAYDTVLVLLQEEHGDAIYKDGHDHFTKEPESEDIETLRAKIAELEEENAKLKAEPKVVVEVNKGGRTWRYSHKTGASRQFTTAEAANLDSNEWKSYPKSS